MPIKDPEKRKEYHREYLKRRYQEDPTYKQTHLQRVKKLSDKRRKAHKELILGLKNNPCADCKEMFHHSMMEFDHKPEFIKKFDIGSGGQAGNLKELIEELDKCDLVCANCHRYRTWIRQQPQ